MISAILPIQGTVQSKLNETYKQLDWTDEHKYSDHAKTEASDDKL